jgi:hypothetical protein
MSNSTAYASMGVSRESLLREQYGELLTLQEISVIFKFPSAEACRKAIARGQLPLQLFQFPNRRGRFATAKTVAAYLDSFDSIQSES